jgi:hypothetical protein
MTELQEQLRHRGAGHELPLERPELPRKDRLDVKFTDEVEYVERQALKVWEPLFGHYYATAWLLAEAAGAAGVRRVQARPGVPAGRIEAGGDADGWRCLRAAKQL